MQETIAPTQDSGFADWQWAVASSPLLDEAVVAVMPVCKVIKEPRWFCREDCVALWQSVQTMADSLLRLPENNQRLGHYFEQLLVAALQHSSRYQLLAHNVVLSHEQRTLGEFDLIVQDLRDGAVEHWEVAVKFYLGCDDIERTQNWHGAHFRDRLDRKLKHLWCQQTQLAWSEQGQTLLDKQGWPVSRTRVFCKGRLFYPLQRFLLEHRVRFAATNHLRGFWATQAQFREWISPDRHLAYVPRMHLLAALSAQTSLVSTGQLPELAAGDRPCLLAVCDDSGNELMRGFVVPDDWPEQARQMAEAPD